MSKADEMFEELGYKKYYNENVEEIEGKIVYIKRYTATDNIIEFDLVHQGIMVAEDSKYTLHAEYFSVKELQAINEKCRELGWLDE